MENESRITGSGNIIFVTTKSIIVVLTLVLRFNFMDSVQQQVFGFLKISLSWCSVYVIFFMERDKQGN